MSPELLNPNLVGVRSGGSKGSGVGAIQQSVYRILRGSLYRVFTEVEGGVELDLHQDREDHLSGRPFAGQDPRALGKNMPSLRMDS